MEECSMERPSPPNPRARLLPEKRIVSLILQSD